MTAGAFPRRYARGGVDAVLAMAGLYALMSKHNLEYPKFYPRLYGLLTREALCGAHRAVFARELNLFLSSSGLPAYLLAAFAKRLGRLALSSSPSGAALACGLVFNIMLRHPTTRVLIHRAASAARPTPSPFESLQVRQQPATEEEVPVRSQAAFEAWRDEKRRALELRRARAARGEEVDSGSSGDESEESDGREGEEGEEGEDEAAAAEPAGSADRALLRSLAAADPFAPDEADPEASHALDSCLWELDHLRAHCCPAVASTAALFASHIAPNTPPLELEPFAEMSYAALGQVRRDQHSHSISAS
jgi:hypothetical protein